jgi:hypothetical protein
MLLNQFGEILHAAFGEVAYHVGSSMTPGTKTEGWRDVDVRLMLDDEVWKSMGLGRPENPHMNAKWRALCIVFSKYGQQLTGLPIDFQLQQRTHANENYRQSKGCARSALIVVNEERPSAHEVGDEGGAAK